MRKRSKRILTAIGIIIIVLGVVYAIMIVRSTARLRRAYAALEADGRPMRAAEVIPPEVPDAENAAVLYQSAALMLRGQPAGDKNLLEQIEALSRERDKQAELKELIGREIVASAVSMVEQGTCRPACRFDRDYGGSLEMDLPALNDVRFLAYVLRAKTQSEAEAGNKDRAWRLVMTALKLGDSLRSDPVPQGQFMRMGIIRRTCGLIQDLCEAAPPSAQDYDALEGSLKSLDDAAPLVRAVDGERLLIGEWLFNLPRAKLDEVLWKDVSRDTGDAVPEAIQKAFHRIIFTITAFRPRLIADHAACLELMRKRVKLLRDPYQGQIAYRKMDKIGIWNFLTYQLAGFGNDKGLYCSMSANLRMTRAGLALIQYKQAHGEFPQTLDALGIEGLVDPFIEKPLRYRVQGEGFVVYSVNSDQEDNGGTPRPEKQDSDPRRKPVNYDLVWQYPKPAGQPKS